MTHKTPRTQPPLSQWRTVALRAFALSSGWWIISGGDRASLAFGIPAVLLALAASLWLSPGPSPRWSAAGLLLYGFAFLLGSWRGGVDVARRALAPRLALNPRIIQLRLQLRTEAARHLFMGTLNLLPGTLGVALDGDDLAVHALVDQGDAGILQLRELEARVARAVGEPLERAHA